MTIAYHRPTRAIIHKRAITENVANRVSQLNDGQALFAVVKANGYGHGAVEAAIAAKKGGATGFCVAVLDEALELRNAGLKDPILILGVVAVEYLPFAAAHDLMIPVASKEWLCQALHFMEHHPTTHAIKLHMKVDTGMGRIGFVAQEEILTSIEQIDQSTSFLWDGIFTHFATADEEDPTYWQQQKQQFETILACLPRIPNYVHISNSATILEHQDTIGNMIRYGVAMYGLNPAVYDQPLTQQLKPAMELISEIIQVKQLPAGCGISYGKTYLTNEGEWIGTVPIGYADGWLRKMQGFSVLVDGHYCEIVGRVCMDQLMIRLPKAYPTGTKVTLIGENGGLRISMQEVADYLGTIHYEVACTISTRVPRKYKD